MKATIERDIKSGAIARRGWEDRVSAIVNGWFSNKTNRVPVISEAEMTAILVAESIAFRPSKRAMLVQRRKALRRRR